MTSSVSVRALAGDEGLVLGWSRDSNHVTTQAEKKREHSLSGHLPVRFLGGLEDGGFIGLVGAPHRMDNAHPMVGKRAHRDAVTLPLPPLPLVVGHRPCLFGELRLPGELVEGVAQGLDTGIAFMGLTVLPTLKRDWRGAGQALACSVPKRSAPGHHPTPPASEAPSGRLLLAGSERGRHRNARERGA